MLKTGRIEKLDEDYILAAHPFPQIEGEMILFQINPQDQDDKDIMVYDDYSLRKRLPTSKRTGRMTAF